VQNLLLACHYFGLGACFVASIAANAPRYRKLLKVKPFEKITAFIWMGYYKGAPLPRIRRKADEVLRLI
jgi:nitroreductase